MGTVTYWNQLAADFDNQVLQISQCDVHGVIERTARGLRGRRKLAIDFGCGPGAVTRTIAPFFGGTTGVDFAEDLLREAQRLSTDFDISYQRRDLAHPPDPASPQADVGFCANVLIHKSSAVRGKMADHICHRVREGGHLVVVVPSYESALRTYQTLSRCRQRDGHSAAQARRSLDRQAGAEIRSVTDGIIDVGGTPTKHFLQDEITQLLDDHDIEVELVELVERVEFAWTEEIDHPPTWLQSPGPWDWLVRGRVWKGPMA